MKHGKKYVDSAKAVEGIAAVPFHAGAVKYFTEIGVMEAEAPAAE